jgi:hypothetical protein
MLLMNIIVFFCILWFVIIKASSAVINWKMFSFWNQYHRRVYLSQSKTTDYQKTIKVLLSRIDEIMRFANFKFTESQHIMIMFSRSHWISPGEFCVSWIGYIILSVEPLHARLVSSLPVLTAQIPALYRQSLRSICT